MKHLQQNTSLNILLADDDTDDRYFFETALTELPIPTDLTTVHDGDRLMDFLLKNSDSLPDVLFLDLNMPRKKGFECLSEIKQDDKLKQLPIIIFSTSGEKVILDLLYDNGAQYYIRKPAEFSKLRMVIYQALSLIQTGNLTQPPKEKFLLTGDIKTQIA